MVYLFGMPDGSNLEQRWGRVVTGEVVIDGKQLYNPGDRLCTSPVSRSPGNLVHTRAGEVYTLFGEGLTVELPVTVLPQLMALESVKEIAQATGQWRG
ncbi:MAG: hypothetical protein ACJA11_003395 [Glaciecola sp.]|jgi:hypothetical protein